MEAFSQNVLSMESTGTSILSSINFPGNASATYGVTSHSLRWVMFVFIPLGLVHRPRVCPSVLNTIFSTILRSGPILAPEMIPLAAIVHEPFPAPLSGIKNPRIFRFPMQILGEPKEALLPMPGEWRNSLYRVDSETNNCCLIHSGLRRQSKTR